MVVYVVIDIEREDGVLAVYDNEAAADNHVISLQAVQSDFGERYLYSAHDVKEQF